MQGVRGCSVWSGKPRRNSEHQCQLTPSPHWWYRELECFQERKYAMKQNSLRNIWVKQKRLACSLCNQTVKLILFYIWQCVNINIVKNWFHFNYCNITVLWILRTNQDCSVLGINELKTNFHTWICKKSLITNKLYCQILKSNFKFAFRWVQSKHLFFIYLIFWSTRFFFIKIIFCSFI